MGNDTFKIRISYLFPKGYGKDTTPFEVYEEGEREGTVKFALRNTGSRPRKGYVPGEKLKDQKGELAESEVLGFGLFDTVGAMTDQEKKGGSIEATADVWFERV